MNDILSSVEAWFAASPSHSDIAIVASKLGSISDGPLYTPKNSILILRYLANEVFISYQFPELWRLPYDHG